MTREFEFATACCRYNFSGTGGDDLVHLSSGIDWPRFLHLIRRHRVEALAARALHNNHISSPAAIADALARHAVATAESNLRAASECSRLQAAFGEAQVPLLFVKGLTLSRLAYGDPFLKMSADIDILVEPHDLDHAARLLAAMGLQLVLPCVDAQSTAFSKWHKRCKESVWRNPETGLILELHTQLADNSSLIPSIGIASPRQHVAVGKGRLLPTLAREELFAYLCVHGASSAWFRLKWIADVAGYLQRTACDAIEPLYRSAQSYGAGRAPAQALLLAERLFQLEIPTRLLDELRSDAANRLLTTVALRQLYQEREPTERPLGTASIHLSQLLLIKGLSFKASEARRQVDALRLVSS